MLIAKLKPDLSVCRKCLDVDIEYGRVSDCSKCSVRNKECQIISAEMKKVSMSRLYDIEEENK